MPCLLLCKKHKNLQNLAYVPVQVKKQAKLMGLQLVALVKLKFLAMAHSHCSWLVTAMPWPFLLKLPFHRINTSRACADLAAASTFFFFRLRQILFDNQQIEHNGRRWERALRLFCERAIDARRYSTAHADHASLYSVSMITL